MFALFPLAAQEAATPGAPRRLALVIGNGAYKKLPPLNGIKGDVSQMQSALKDAGFLVTVTTDATLDLLQKALISFIDTVKPGDVCFFYFAGYAIQVEQDNYLLPLDIEPAAKQDLGSLPSLTGIQQYLDEKKAGLKILVLEASRKNDALMAQGIGLASPDVGTSNEIVFAFSAAPNQFADDKSDVFTKFLAAAIREKGLTLDEIFQKVRNQVLSATGDRQKILQQIFVTKPFLFHEAEKRPDPIPLPAITVVKVPEGRKVGTLGTNHQDRQDYVWIPAGSFKMGCVPNDPKCKPEEKPQHAVKIAHGFWFGRNEVTTGAYQRFIDASKKARKMPQEAPVWDGKWRLTEYPMVEETWEDAKAFCEWSGGRLPTEAEWEYAARAGKDDEIYPLNDENSRDKANFEGTKGNDKWEQAAPVRSFDPNAFGLFDMAGNVWEWCLDLFNKSYYADSPPADPPGPSAGAPQHVVRGGSWYSDPKQHLRISYRDTRKPGNSVGFRCVLPDTPATDDLLKAR